MLAVNIYLGNVLAVKNILYANSEFEKHNYKEVGG